MEYLLKADVLTLHPDLPRAEAVLVSGERIRAVGSVEDLRGIAPQAEVLDFGDRILTPGLTDAHIHLVNYGFRLSQVNLEGCSSVAEVQQRLREYALQHPEGWIVGGGYTITELGLSDYPARGLLDEVIPDRPVLLYSRDLHSAWANSLALKTAGLTDSTPDPEGGELVRVNGLLTGYLLESASERVQASIPAPTWEETLKAARLAVKTMRDFGYTAVHTMAYEPADHLRALMHLEQQGELPLRVWACIPHTELEHAIGLGLYGGHGDRVKLGGVKFFLDGALGSQTAWMLAPGYQNPQATPMILDQPELIRERAEKALQHGFIPTVHAIGDQANRVLLDLYEELKPLADQKGLHLRLEHAQHLSPQDIVRFGELQVTASMQPVHLIGDARLVRELVPHLEDGTYAVRSLKQAGALLAFGSDGPVASPDPRLSFEAATKRLGLDGAPFSPQECLTAEETLWAHTRGPALAVGWEDYGIIREGARADFTLWDTLGGKREALTFPR
ncbi:amidohydrolase [Deinococcus cellulosilyticus]|nr:amidohydrolase [Deinococcus cellulosilyticus]